MRWNRSRPGWVAACWAAEPLGALRVRALDAPDGADRAFAQVAVRHELALWLGTGPDLVDLRHACAQCGASDHGALVAPSGLWVSLSRAPGLVLVAISDAGPVGVDVEVSGAAAFPGFDDVALHPGESAGTSWERTRVWVRKEAVLKALGVGLRLDPRRLRVSAPGELAAVLGWHDVEAPRDPVWLEDIDVGPGHQAAVAVIGPAAPPPPELIALSRAGRGACGRAATSPGARRRGRR